MIGCLVDEQAEVEVARLIGVLVVELALIVSGVTKWTESDVPG